MDRPHAATLSGPAHRRRRTLRVFVAAALAALAAVAIAVPAEAQSQRPRTIFDLLFRPREASKPAIKQPRATKPKAKLKSKSVRRKTSDSESLAAQGGGETPAIVEKAADARVVLVVGDFVAGGLAEGLTAAMEGNANVRLVERTNGSSGFVRDDYFNWPVEVASLIQSEKPAALVVMLGANDRQQMKIGETREQPLTEAWKAEYSRRVSAFAAAARAGGVPLIWVGQPSFKATSMATGMIALNDIFRVEAQKVGATYVDIWDGFVDEAGAFATTGPDISGQPARLRANDGINLTKAGRRKIAFYVEKPLAKLLGAPASVPSVAVAVPSPGDLRLNAPAPVIDRTAPISLDDPALDGGSELLGAVLPGAPSPRMPGAPPSGRADDFSAPAIVRLAPAID
ncbi:MAG: DUF459 domain-containing protein [Phyllobacteriaceae bacterium]|nr:DUF459 domain-containing protein [Phyllobacteriaceae bacterium]